MQKSRNIWWYIKIKVPNPWTQTYKASQIDIGIDLRKAIKKEKKHTKKIIQKKSNKNQKSIFKIKLSYSNPSQSIYQKRIKPSETEADLVKTCTADVRARHAHQVEINEFAYVEERSGLFKKRSWVDWRWTCVA